MSDVDSKIEPLGCTQTIRSGCVCCTRCVCSCNSSARPGRTLPLVERWGGGVRARSRLAHWRRGNRGFGRGRSGRRVGCDRSAGCIAGGGGAGCRTGLWGRHGAGRACLLRQHESLSVCVTRHTPGERDHRRWGCAPIGRAGRLIPRGVGESGGDECRGHSGGECAHHEFLRPASCTREASQPRLTFCPLVRKPRQGCGLMSGNSRSKLPPRIKSTSRAFRFSRSSASTWVSKIARCQPRGKKEESVPNSRRSGPSTWTA
jgi:hypothetical protein